MVVFSPVRTVHFYFRASKSIMWLRPGLSLRFFCGRLLSGQNRSIFLSCIQTHRVASARVRLLRSSFGHTSGVTSFGQDRHRSSFDTSKGVISLGQDAVPMSNVQTHHVASARVPLLRSSFGRTSRVISFRQDRLRSFFGPPEGVISLGQDPVQYSMSKPIMWLLAGSPFSGLSLALYHKSSP